MDISVEVMKQPEFWQQAWSESRKNLPYIKRRIRTEKESMEFWNKFAPSYENCTSDKGKERIEKVIDILAKDQMITPEARVIDIGCGPGTYALPLVNRVKSITALDGAEDMCRILEQKVQGAGIKNIKVLHRMWEDMDIKKEGLEKQFELAFASITPAICDYDTLNKLNQVSRKYCCHISWAGGSLGKARQDLWELLFQEKDAGHGYNIIFPFNILFNSGFFPSMRYIDSQWIQENPVEEAVERLCDSFWLYTEITPGVKDIITRYVGEKAVGGIFRQEFKARLGIITWRVDEARR